MCVFSINPELLLCHDAEFAATKITGIQSRVAAPLFVPTYHIHRIHFNVESGFSAMNCELWAHTMVNQIAADLMMPAVPTARVCVCAIEHECEKEKWPKSLRTLQSTFEYTYRYTVCDGLWIETHRIIGT